MGRGAARGSRRRKSGGSPLRPVPAGRRFPLGLWLGETGVERALLVGPIFVVLIVELLNSAVEAAIDRIGLERHPLSGLAKDIGSAAVFTSFALLVVVWLLVLLDH